MENRPARSRSVAYGAFYGSGSVLPVDPAAYLRSNPDTLRLAYLADRDDRFCSRPRESICCLRLLWSVRRCCVRAALAFYGATTETNRYLFTLKGANRRKIAYAPSTVLIRRKFCGSVPVLSPKQYGPVLFYETSSKPVLD